MSIGFLQGRRSATLTFCGLMVACLTWSAGCHRSGSSAAGVKVLTTIEPQPAHVGPVTVTVQIADAHARQLSGAQVQIEGDMAHPGMPPVFHDAGEIAPGKYVAYLKLNMPGDWIILTHVRLANGLEIQQQTNLSGVTQQ